MDLGLFRRGTPNTRYNCGGAVPDEITVTITQRILVHAEIADEIVWLNEQGVRTESSCSGHGIDLPTAMIKPSSAKRAKELGYVPWFKEYLGLFEIKLRGQIVEQPITLEKVVEQPYKDASFRAGLVQGHEVDTIYFEIDRDERPQLTMLLRSDEALALIWVLSGALWSEQIQD